MTHPIRTQILGMLIVIALGLLLVWRAESQPPAVLPPVLTPPSNAELRTYDMVSWPCDCKTADLTYGRDCLCVLQAYSATTEAERADINRNGRVDVEDYLILARHFGWKRGQVDE